MKQHEVEELKLKYEHYRQQGKMVFMVTLSTYVKGESFARSVQMHQFWNHDFLHRIKRRLPEAMHSQIDHDFVIERSPHGHYHFHGLLSMSEDAGKKIWRTNALHKQIARDLDSFKYDSEYRNFNVNDYLIEPTRPGNTPSDWIDYITTTADYIPSWHLVPENGIIYMHNRKPNPKPKLEPKAVTNELRKAIDSVKKDLVPEHLVSRAA